MRSASSGLPANASNLASVDNASDGVLVRFHLEDGE